MLGVGWVGGRRRVVGSEASRERRQPLDAGGLGRVACASAGEWTRVSVTAREADGKHARDGRGRVGVEAADVEPRILRQALHETVALTTTVA